MESETLCLSLPYSNYSRRCTYISAKQLQNIEDQSITCYSKALNLFLAQKDYPCVGARTALNSKSYAFGLFDKMECWRTPLELASGLSTYLKEMATRQSDFLTYIAIFKFDNFESEISFEKSLWDLLGRLHHIDMEHSGWSAEVGCDPTKSDFAYSFGGKGFYLVGMHPLSSRKARRFSHAAIAFNLHSQFKNLRNKKRYQRFKRVVRENEMSFDGSINPMLSDFGEGLEAPQYSGREVGTDWKCPFKKQDARTQTAK